jgi:predicted  nucleic acid-binding Zn-ribbon protein
MIPYLQGSKKMEQHQFDLMMTKVDGYWTRIEADIKEINVSIGKLFDNQKDLSLQILSAEKEVSFMKASCDDYREDMDKELKIVHDRFREWEHKAPKFVKEIIENEMNKQKAKNNATIMSAVIAVVISLGSALYKWVVK